MHPRTTSLLALSLLALTPVSVTLLEGETVRDELALRLREEIHGTLEEVDPEARVLRLEVKGRTLELSLGPDTRYLLDGEGSTPELALRAGRRATVAHEQGHATRVAVRTSE